jgi:hypothetical protein
MPRTRAGRRRSRPRSARCRRSARRCCCRTVRPPQSARASPGRAGALLRWREAGLPRGRPAPPCSAMARRPDQATPGGRAGQASHPSSLPPTVVGGHGPSGLARGTFATGASPNRDGVAGKIRQQRGSRVPLRSQELGDRGVGGGKGLAGDSVVMAAQQQFGAVGTGGGRECPGLRSRTSALT